MRHCALLQTTCLQGPHTPHNEYTWSGLCHFIQRYKTLEEQRTYYIKLLCWLDLEQSFEPTQCMSVFLAIILFYLRLEWKIRFSVVSCSLPTAGVPGLRDLMPHDLSWRWYNNRNKMHNKWIIRRPSPPHPQSMEKLSSMKPVPAAKKVGDLWSTAPATGFWIYRNRQTVSPWPNSSQAPPFQLGPIHGHVLKRPVLIRTLLIQLIQNSPILHVWLPLISDQIPHPPPLPSSITMDCLQQDSYQAGLARIIPYPWCFLLWSPPAPRL